MILMRRDYARFPQIYVTHERSVSERASEYPSFFMVQFSYMRRHDFLMDAGNRNREEKCYFY